MSAFNLDNITGGADNSFDIILFFIIRILKNHDIAAFRLIK